MEYKLNYISTQLIKYLFSFRVNIFYYILLFFSLNQLFVLILQSRIIGGGFYMVYFNSSSGSKTVVDAREVASTNYFEKKNNFLQYFGVPGQLNGLR